MKPNPEHGRAYCLTCIWDDYARHPQGLALAHEAMYPHHNVGWSMLHSDGPARTFEADTVVTDPETGGRKGAKLAQFSQIPADVLWELAEHYGKGLAKYPDAEGGEPNWQRGYSWRLSVDAMLRHINQFLMGEDVDPDNGSSHLIAAAWHLFALRWFQLHGKGRDFR